MTGLRVEDLRRGQKLGWDWGKNAVGLDMQARGIAPAGRIVTHADLPHLACTRLGLQVEGRPELVLDPILAIEKGKTFHLIEDAPVPKVLNAHKDGKERPGAVYVGRPSPWGNPFSLGKDGTREEVIAKYIDWLHESPEFVGKARRALAGKDLICWCAPAACHAEILRDLALGKALPDRVIPRQQSLFDPSP